MSLGTKNTLIGVAIGALTVAGGMALFNGNDSSTMVRDDDPSTTRTTLPTGGPDKDCPDFSTQRQAQVFFEANGGPSKDPHNLDRDGDGRVCETLP